MTKFSELLPYFYQALEAKYGIVLRTTDPDKLKSRLYTARQAHNDPTLSDLSILTSRSAPTEEVWIIKKASLSGEKEESPDAD